MRAVFLAAVLSLAACQTPCPGPQSGSVTQSFACEDGSHLEVTFNYAPGSARIVQEGFAPLDLPARITGSGFRYADNGADLRERGAIVYWTRPGAAQTECRRR